MVWWLAGTAFPCILRLLGARVGHDVLIAGKASMLNLVIDAKSIRLGNGVIINYGSYVLPHSVDRGLMGHPIMRQEPCGKSRAQCPSNN